ncbi:unnamed protein product [Linum tenue]|uniref:Olee1-like protein n=1 Tax=Linum tenue TaxID=586396 RepID=A0AAV0MDE7_9ROSI|nr:unnamed protein product [Linum tenue]CAI0444807.1 unnamed protein product [Linum tenue]
MEKVFIVASALICLLGLLGTGTADTFTVEGKVYCDTCRTQFITRITEFMPDAVVRLECKDREGGSITFSADAISDTHGVYHIPVQGDHEDEICEVFLVKSPRPDCSGIPKPEKNKEDSARVSITKNNGMISGVRRVSPMGFLITKAKPECAEVLRELGITPQGLVP